MGKKRKVTQTAPPMAPSAVEERKNFGTLKINGTSLSQSTAILKDKARQNFSKLSFEQLMGIIQGTDLNRIREVSKWFAQTFGVYGRAVRYLADIYRFDYLIYPNLALGEELKDKVKEKVLKKTDEVLEHFDSSTIQGMCRKWASTVCLEGVYYGYICDDITDRLVIQDLPLQYCRSRFFYRGLPIIEFNLDYFEKVSNNQDEREQILKLFPLEFQKGWNKYKNTRDGKPGPQWIMLDLQRAFKFNFNDSDMPPFLSVIPALVESAEVRELEKEKLLQQIRKVLIQELELDKNGQIPFNINEIQDLQGNAEAIARDAVGLSVLTTVAKVKLEDVGKNIVSDGKQSIDSAKEAVFDELGVSTNLFNTAGNLALEKSVATDEALVKPLLLQFESFFNNYLAWRFSQPKLKFRMKILSTTIFNYKDLSNMYQQLTKIGFSRFLPMVALGHTQKEVASLARFEQQALDLDTWMLPPFSSNTMSSDTWSQIRGLQDDALEGQGSGRPELPDDQKSDKTIANLASEG